MAIKKILTNLEIDGSVTAGSFIKDGGGSSQFLKADGSVDSSDYLLNTTDTFLGDLTVTGTLYANTGVNLKDGEHVIFDSDNDNYAKIGTDSNDDMLYESANSHMFKNGEDGSFEAVKASHFIKDGGTSSQFLKANGSVDSSDYVLAYEIPYTEQIALSDETTALTTGTSKVTFRSPGNIRASLFRLSCATAPTGSVITVDVNVEGVSILSTKLTIDAGEKTSRTAVNAMQFVTGADVIGNDNEITIDIDGVGSTIAGAGLKLIMYYKYSVILP